MKIKQDNLIIQSELRDYRLDAIKALSICFVFIWHVIPYKAEHFIPRAILSLILDNLSLTGVPCFITVSMMLFYQKAKDEKYL